MSLAAQGEGCELRSLGRGRRAGREGRWLLVRQPTGHPPMSVAEPPGSGEIVSQQPLAPVRVGEAGGPTFSRRCNSASAQVCRLITGPATGPALFWPVPFASAPPAVERLRRWRQSRKRQPQATA
jgi:hypothetical protein